MIKHETNRWQKIDLKLLGVNGSEKGNIWYGRSENTQNQFLVNKCAKSFSTQPFLSFCLFNFYP